MSAIRPNLGHVRAGRLLSLVLLLQARGTAHRLAGFGDQVEVLAPPAVRTALVATARQILARYHADDG
jgi:hypothetical protein